MKEPERLIGFVNYDDSEIAFEFDADDFVLNLYPPKELWKKYSRPFYAFSKHPIRKRCADHICTSRNGI